MGFQFNHVGGGTKTRRPITLHMKYNSGCVQPTCYLMLEDVGEQEVSLEELQVGPCHIYHDSLWKWLLGINSLASQHASPSFAISLTVLPLL